jgi:hypothetical protein
METELRKILTEIYRGQKQNNDEAVERILLLFDVSGSLRIPISTLGDWIDRLDWMEYDLNHRIYVKDDIEKFVTDAERQLRIKI